jgi:flagellar hook-basal body complex protein FliE
MSVSPIGQIGALGGIGAVGGAGDVGRLGEMYRQQLLGGTQAGEGVGAAGAAGALAVDPAAAARGADFGAAIGQGLRSVEALDGTASTKAIQAATGDLKDVHDYVIAATQAQVATELTTTVRNKALEAFNDIMRMPL